MKKFFTLFVLSLLLCPMTSMAGQIEWKMDWSLPRITQERDYWCVHACNVILGKYSSQTESFIAYYLMETPVFMHDQIRRRIQNEPEFLESLIQQLGPVLNKYILQFCRYNGRKELFRAFTRYDGITSMPTMASVLYSSNLDGDYPVSQTTRAQCTGHAFVLSRVYFSYGDILSPDYYVITYMDPAFGGEREKQVSLSQAGGFDIYY